MSFRALGSSVSLRLPPLPSSFALGINPATIVDRTDGMVPKAAGEPSLSAALSSLTADEAADYKTWGSSEKLQFLTGYQYIAVMSASGLRRPDGTLFEGLFGQGIAVALSAMQAALPYIKLMPPETAQAADQMASVVKDASAQTNPRATDFARKHALLRDRIAWELATQNDLTLEYEIVGTDPSNPGVIYTRKIGADRSPDYSAVFSTRSPKQLFDDGVSLQDKYESLGVTFKRLDMSGANPRLGAGPALILSVLITIVVAMLTFYWMWNHINQQNHLTKLSVDLITSDSSLSNTQKAAQIAALSGANSFFTQFFGSAIPWTEILIVVGIGALALLAYPYFATERRGGYLSGAPTW